MAPPPRPLVVVFPLTTSITISSLPTPLPTALKDLIPTYDARPDGSLITTRYMSEIKNTNLRLFIIGLVLMLFIRNAIISTDYLYRSRSKDKTLFYLLVASQIFGPVCFISQVVSYLLLNTSCEAVEIISLISTAVSEGLLITGILGIKAYRCLDQSRVVLFVISLLQVASTALLFYDVSRLRSHRTASGSCDTTGSFRICPFAMLVLFLQSLFICICFVYTVWKTSPYAAAQGRLSLAVSLESIADECDCPLSPAMPDDPERRGWWDYVPDRHEPFESPEAISIFSRISQLFFSNSADPQTTAPARKPSLATDKPLPQPARLTEKSQPALPVPPPCPAQRRSGPIARIRLVRAAMRDELFHAAAVALNCILTIILLVVGFIKLNLLWSPTVWLGVNWAVTSLIVMHSFSQVVRRHEREAILRDPNTWNPTVMRAGRRAAWRPTPSSISISIASRRLRHQVDTSESQSQLADDHRSAVRSWDNPFRDSRSIARQDHLDEAAGGEEPEPSPSPTPPHEFLPNNYPERVVTKPLESPTI